MLTLLVGPTVLTSPLDVYAIDTIQDMKTRVDLSFHNVLRMLMVGWEEGQGQGKSRGGGGGVGWAGAQLTF